MVGAPVVPQAGWRGDRLGVGSVTIMCRLWKADDLRQLNAHTAFPLFLFGSHFSCRVLNLLAICCPSSELKSIWSNP